MKTLREIVPTQLKHLVSRFTRKAAGDVFETKLLNQDIRLTHVDNLSTSWYSKSWTVENRREFAFLAPLVSDPSSVVFNIGAHQGVVAILLKRLLVPEGRVVAVEIDKLNANACVENIRINDEANIVVLNKAISKSKAPVHYTGLSNSSIATASALNIFLPKISSTTIDDLMEEYGVPSLIYLDVEGAEVLAIKGAKKSLERVTTWFLEVHGDEICAIYGGSNADVIESLKGAGYVLYYSRSETSEFTEMDPETIISDRGFLIAHKA